MQETLRVDRVPTYESVEAWIRAEAIPVAMQSDAAFDACIDRLVAEMGDGIEVMGMGEALHGGEEILQFRNRLFQRLVTHHGYSAIALESSFPRSRVVNAYVTGRSTATYDTLQDSGFSHGFGRLAANRELVEWMRQYNATREETDQIHFYGFDGPVDAGPTDSPRHLLHFVLDYLALIDKDAAARYHDQMDPLLGDDAPWENYEVAMNPSLGLVLSPNATALRVITENLISELHERLPEVVAAQGMNRFLAALHDATAARHLLTYHAVLAQPASDRQAHLLNIRTVMMSDNVLSIANRERGKVLLFAHNAHLQRRKVEWQYGSEAVHWWPVGAQLQVLFGNRYAAIASAVGASPENGITAAEPDTVEALLTDSGSLVTLLPTHTGHNLPTNALRDTPARSGSTKNGSYSATTPPRITDFDWLVTFGSVSYHRRTDTA